MEAFENSLNTYWSIEEQYEKDDFLSELQSLYSSIKMINRETYYELKEIILSKIKENKSFDEIATLLSISDSSKTGGKLGWIKENALNQLIKKELVALKPGDITKPMVIPGGILILKINNIRKVEREIDFNKEIQLVIRNKTNEQLNQFSILYFNKIKKDVIINEL